MEVVAQEGVLVCVVPIGGVTLESALVCMERIERVTLHCYAWSVSKLS